MADLLTIEQMDRVLPKQLKGALTQSMVDGVNAVLSDPILAENYRDNLLGYTHVLKDGKYKMESYLDAVRYVSFKLMGDSNVAAYTKTFPDRYQRLISEGATDKDISAYVAAYSKNKLVNAILEQTIIPVHVLNQDLYQKALNQQAYLMMNAKSEKVQSDAANSLLTQLRPPDVKKMELDVTVSENSAIDELRQATMALARQQREMIQSGRMSAQDVAHSNVMTIDNDTQEAV